MALLQFWGAETGDLSGSAYLFGTAAAQATTVNPNGGAYAYQIPSSTSSALGFGLSAAQTTVFYRFYYLIDGATTGQGALAGFGDTNENDDIAYLLLNANGTITAINAASGGATLGTGTAIISPNTWTLVEVKIVVGAGSGIVEVKINGVIDQSYAGLTNNAFGGVQNIELDVPTGVGAVNTYFDDIAVSSSGYIGPGHSKISQFQPGTPTSNTYTLTGGATIDATWNLVPFSTAHTAISANATAASAQTALTKPFTAAQCVTAAVDSTNRTGSTGTTSTVTGVTFGAAFVGRTIVIPCYTSGGGGTPTAATINGFAATIEWNTTDSAGFIIAEVPTGTSGSVVFTLSASGVAHTDGAISVTNAGSVYPVSTINNSSSGSGALAIPLNGTAVAYATASGAGTWTGANQLIALNGVNDTVASFDNTTGTYISSQAISYSTGAAMFAVAFTPANQVTSNIVDSTARTGTSSTTSTITAVPFGVAFPNRVICVECFTASVGATPTAITIGGIAATIIGSGSEGMIASAVVPTGTTGTIIATYASAAVLKTDSVVALSGAISAVPVANIFNTGGGSGTINIPQGGTAIAYSGGGSAGTWSGATQVLAFNTNGSTTATADNLTGGAQSQTISYSTGTELIAAAFAPMYGPGYILPAATINGAKVGAIALASSTAGSRNLGSVRTTIAGTVTDTNVTLTTAAAYYETAVYTDTLANIDTSQAGWNKRASTTAGTQTVYDVWVMVDYSSAIAVAATSAIKANGNALIAGSAALSATASVMSKLSAAISTASAGIALVATGAIKLLAYTGITGAAAVAARSTAQVKGSAAPAGKTALAALSTVQVTARATFAGALALAAKATSQLKGSLATPIGKAALVALAKVQATASVSLLGKATLAAISKVQLSAKASTSSSAVLFARAAYQVKAAATVAGALGLSAASKVLLAGRALPPGAIALVAAAFVKLFGKASPKGTAQLTGQNTLTLTATAVPSGSASLTANTSIMVRASAAITAVAPLVALSAINSIKVAANGTLTVIANLGALSTINSIKVFLSAAISYAKTGPGNGTITPINYPRIINTQPYSRTVTPANSDRTVNVPSPEDEPC